MEYIGVTETGDPAFNLDIFDRLYKANIIITKHLSDKLIDKLVENKEKCILHFTVTGWGRTKVEPFVPCIQKSKLQFRKLIDKGFPIEQVVLRIDPIIPTEEGIERASFALELFLDSKIKRIRFSILDLYNHVKERFKENNIELPYNTFHAPLKERKEIWESLKEIGEKYNIDIEVCGEPGIESISCLSQKDIDILGLTNEIKLVGNSNQRYNCSCPANKRQLIKNGYSKKCGHKCLYCYIKDN